MVTITITGGPTLTFPWAEKMTGQSAMEAAFNNEPVTADGSRKFIFMLQYYGALGYLVDMINGTFDCILWRCWLDAESPFTSMRIGIFKLGMFPVTN